MKISYGNSRHETKWKNSDISWEDFKQRVSTTVRTTETVQEYLKLPKGRRDDIKDIGGFVGGHLKSGRRKKGNVLSRSMLTLDMDYGTPGVWDEVLSKLPYRCCVYSTHKHTPEIPTAASGHPSDPRCTTETEYEPMARMFAKGYRHRHV
jgi:putative DNA primase/helicase